MKLLEIWDSKIFRKQAEEARRQQAQPQAPQQPSSDPYEWINKGIQDYKYNNVSSEEIDDLLYHIFADEMPYGTAKARTGDPKNWIADEIGRMNDLEIDDLIDKARDYEQSMDREIDRQSEPEYWSDHHERQRR